MSGHQSAKRVVGCLSLMTASILILSAASFWPAREEYGAGLGSKMMAAMAVIVGLCFGYLALAMFLPKRFQRFWRWWRNGM